VRSTSGQKALALLGVAVTLALLHVVPDRLLVIPVLLLAWAVLFYPLSTGELVMFVVAGSFFLLQNYVTLAAGLFEFRDQDILLMPWFEPFLWGFYFLGMKRFVSGRAAPTHRVGLEAVVGLVVTSAAFSLFSYDSRALLLATSVSTLVLLALFHDREDLSYALYALVLGFVVEIFGVWTGVWRYPAPDFLGIPYWFATMWISVGLLGRRFLLPVSEWLARRLRGQGA
jgi:hypothetical protein